MVTRKTVKMYSFEDKAIVDWDVAEAKETDEGGNEHEFITLKYKNEEHRLSPATTDAELDRIINDEDGVRIQTPLKR